MEDEDIKALMQRRRAQMLVHSYIYYELDDSLVTDQQWQQWADELAAMPFQKIGFYDHAFVGWDGSTGFHLPRDAWAEHKARQLLRQRDWRDDLI